MTAEIREDAGYPAEEIDKLRRGGHIVICGAVRFWRPFIRLDLIDELQLNLFRGAAGFREHGQAQ